MKSWLELYQYFPELINKYGRLLQDDECYFDFTVRKHNGRVTLIGNNHLDDSDDSASKDV